MQKIVVYNQLVCHQKMRDNFNASQYQADTSFVIQPMEDILVLIYNCGNNWFQHGMSFEMRWSKSQQRMLPAGGGNRFQMCLWVKNYSTQCQVRVTKGSKLMDLLDQPDIINKLCHIPVEDMHLCYNRFLQSEEPLTEEEEEEEEAEEDEEAATQETEADEQKKNPN